MKNKKLEVKKEYIAKLKKIRKGKYIKFKSIKDLRKATLKAKL